MARASNSASRREFLHIGSLTGLGLSLGGLFRLQAARADAKAYEHFAGSAKSVIHIWPPSESPRPVSEPTCRNSRREAEP
ncbi:MAG: hypothetical protein ACKONH_07745, partial [Planctomycetia bacterium]